MESRFAAPDLALLETADRIGKAAYLWLRQNAVRQDAAKRHDNVLTHRQNQYLAAGFISELTTLLDLTTQHALIAAYTYALLDSREHESLAIATVMVEPDHALRQSPMFEQGRIMASVMLDLIEADHFRLPADGESPVAEVRLNG